MENENQNPETEVVTQKKPKNGSGKSNRYMMTINLTITTLLLVIIIVMGARYLLFINQIKKIKIVDQIQNIKLVTTELQNIQLKQQMELQNIMENINKIHQHKELLPIAEAYSSVKTANSILLSKGDTQTAIELLQVAQQSITQIPTLDLVRQVIAKDMTNLQTYAKFNDEALIIRIDKLMQQTANLQQFIQLPISSDKQNTPSATSGAPAGKPSVWYNFSETMQHSLRDVVVIQHNEVSTPPLLPSEQLVNLRLNIQFKLTQAEWAVMYKKPDLYKLCLQDTETWIKAYFPDSVLQANNILENIHELQNINFQATPPNLDNSVNALKNILTQLLQQQTPEQNSHINVVTKPVNNTIILPKQLNIQTQTGQK